MMFVFGYRFIVNWSLVNDLICCPVGVVKYNLLSEDMAIFGMVLLNK